MKYIIMAGREAIAASDDLRWAIRIAMHTPGATHVVDETDTQVWPAPATE